MHLADGIQFWEAIFLLSGMGAITVAVLIALFRK